MSLATNLKKVSKKLIDKFGDTITLTVTVPGTFNPVTFTTSADVVTTYTTKGVITDYFSERSAAGDMKVTFYLDTAIQTLDKITANGVQRTVLALVETSAQDSIIIYDAVLSGDSRVLVT